MRDACECAGQIFPGVILLMATFREGSHGVMNIYRGDLSLETREHGVHFQMGNEPSYLCCSQEPLNWTEQERNVKPSARATYLEYMPHSFGAFDIFDTSNGSRFLLKNRASHMGPNDIMSGDIFMEPYPGQGEVGVILETLDELPDYLEEVLSRLGIPNEDIADFKASILTKIV